MAVELTPLLPNYFRSVVEFQAILGADEKELSALESNMKQVWNNCYVQTCDEPTLSEIERRFHIIPIPGETMDYRRERVLQKYNAVVPFDINYLKERLYSLFGDNYTLSVNPVTSVMTVVVLSDRYGAIDLLYDLLLDIVPAHIKIISNQQVTNYIEGSIYTGGAISSTFVQTI